MRERYEGTDGRRRLIAVLREQRIVEHDEKLASALAEAGEIIEVRNSTCLIKQDGVDNDVYFLLDGEMDVLVNGNVVARRGPRECIGEMVVVDGAARRSATVVARTESCALKVSESSFATIADTFPKVWKPIAKVEAERLRERTKFHRPPNPVPVLFVGSSVEGLPIANEIVSGLKHDNVIARAWSTPGVFSPGGVSVDVLLKEVEHADFAVFVFGPDDMITSRKEEYLGPRDNVVFELGLFMGRLDKSRALIVKEQRTDVKMPTDLLGVTPITYVKKAGQDDATMLAPVCNELRKLVSSLGPR